MRRPPLILPMLSISLFFLHPCFELVWRIIADDGRPVDRGQSRATCGKSPSLPCDHGNAVRNVRCDYVVMQPDVSVRLLWDTQKMRRCVQSCSADECDEFLFHSGTCYLKNVVIMIPSVHVLLRCISFLIFCPLFEKKLSSSQHIFLMASYLEHLQSHRCFSNSETSNCKTAQQRNILTP